jgi:hypothetical protein
MDISSNLMGLFPIACPTFIYAALTENCGLSASREKSAPFNEVINFAEWVKANHSHLFDEWQYSAPWQTQD